MPHIAVTLIPLLAIALFPLLTSIINQDTTKDLLKQLATPQNITKVKEKGADEIVLAFNDWQDSIGIFRDGVEIKPLAPGIRAVYATRDLEPGEVIVSVPEVAMMPEDYPSDDPIINKARESLKDNRLLAVVIYQEMKNPNSRFKAYFDLFPKGFDNFPLFYGEAEYKLIKGTNLFFQIQGFLYTMRARYYEVIRVLPELKDMTEQEFYKVYTHASSRCLTLKIDRVPQYTMVPMFDMLNAYPYTKEEMDCVRVEHKESARDKSILQLITKKKIKAGEEIYDFYRRDYTNTDYLINYGFIFAEINDISLRLNIDFEEGDADIQLKKDILKHIPEATILDKAVMVILKNSTKEEDYWPVYSAARVIEMKGKKQLNTLLYEFQNGKRKNVGRFSNENEKRAMNNLINVVNDILDKHPSTLEEDEKLLKELPLFTTPRNLVHLRREEKLVLMKIRDYCQNTLVELLQK